MPKKQSRIEHHFQKSPRFSTKIPSTAETQHSSPHAPSSHRQTSDPVQSSSDSEGSDGLAGIQLSQVPGSPTRLGSRAKKIPRRILLDSEDEDEDEIAIVVPAAKEKSREDKLAPMEHLGGPSSRTKSSPATKSIVCSSNRASERKRVRILEEEMITGTVSRDRQTGHAPDEDPAPKTRRSRLMQTGHETLKPDRSSRKGVDPQISTSNKRGPYVEPPKLTAAAKRKYIVSSPVLAIPRLPLQALRIESPSSSDLPPTEPLVLSGPSGEGSRGAGSHAGPSKVHATSARPAPRSPSKSSSSHSTIIVRKKKRKQLTPDSLEEELPVKHRGNGHAQPTKKSRPIDRQTASALAKLASLKKRKAGRLSKSAKDPDDREDAVTDDDDVDDLKMDEPSRFKTKTRLRRKTETDYQRQIRKLKNKRLGIVESSTDSEDDEEEEEEEDKDDSSVESVAEDDFIIDDGGRVADGVLPHEFSLNASQTPEFKFKVVFHYLSLLVVKGSKILPLKGEDADYFLPNLNDLRRRIVGYRDARARSQIWHPNLVNALKTYPNLHVEDLPLPEPRCDACNSIKYSPFRVYLEGRAYDKDTHQPLDCDSDSEEEEHARSNGKGKGKGGKRARASSKLSSKDSEDQNKTEFLMGRFCRSRAQVYHKMSHWEHSLYRVIRRYYHDLLRAKIVPIDSDTDASTADSDLDEDVRTKRGKGMDRAAHRLAASHRVNKLRQRKLPKDHRNVNEVIEWMDRDMRYQAKEYRSMEEMIQESETLEQEKRAD